MATPLTPRTQRMRTLASLPPDVLVAIASFLLIREHAPFARSCKPFASACSKPGAWTAVDSRSFNRIAAIGLRCVKHINVDADAVHISGLTLVEAPVTVVIRHAADSIDDTVAQVCALWFCFDR